VTHPVAALLAGRAAAGTRADGHRLALVVEGGGMRGVVSAAMTGALEELGLAGAFDLVAGTSAGALNGAALLAGVAKACAAEYADGFAGREFINPARLLLGRPAVNVEFTLDYSSAALDGDRHARAIASDVELHCVATDVATAMPRALAGMSTLDEMRSALLATSRLPWVGGRPVEFRGRRWLDGGLTEPVPVPTALALGATHVLVLLTRALGVVPAGPARARGPDRGAPAACAQPGPGDRVPHAGREGPADAAVAGRGRRVRAAVRHGRRAGPGRAGAVAPGAGPRRAPRGRRPGTPAHPGTVVAALVSPPVHRAHTLGGDARDQ
jgi:predicted acylesterase/phospholipase RssA